MNELNWNIDELVGKIMADLRKSSVDASGEAASAALTHDFSSLRAANAAADDSGAASFQKVGSKEEAFLVKERVIVADVVLGLARSTSAKRWAVLPNAVVTPSAKDELKKLGIELVDSNSDDDKPASTAKSNASRATLSASNAAVGLTSSFDAGKVSKAKKPAVSTRALIATHLPEAERFPEAVREYLARNAETREVRLDCLKETSKLIAEELGKDKSLKVVLATHDAAIGSIWANRLSGVRAVVAYTFEQTKRDIAAADANVVIVDPRDVGPYPFRQIVDYFIRS